MIEMTEIKITEVGKETIAINTNGYLLLYFKGEEIKSVGHIDPKAFTPIIGKMLLDKLK